LAQTVVAAARQFGSDRGDTGLVADITDLALMTQTGHAAIRDPITSSARPSIGHAQPERAGTPKGAHHLRIQR
jgi:hypothetical protein